jgi:SAM-dependent methyltransferase
MPWDLVSAAYAAEVTPMFEDYARDALALAPIAHGARIVDVACGPGTLSVLAARAGAKADAIDFSPAMIAQLEARLTQLGLTGITARLGDGQALPYETGAFAAGFSMFGLMFFPDRAKGFAELRRVLAPGARAVVATWTRLEETPALEAMFVALRDAMGKALNTPPQPPAELPLTTEDACRTEMGAAFREVEVHRVPHSQHYASVDELWGALQRTMAPIALMKKSTGDRWPALADAARTAMHARLGDGPVDMTMTAFVTTGVA